MDKTTFSQIKSSWFIIIAIVGIIATWTMFNARLAQAENDIDRLSSVVEQINLINIQLAIIQTDLAYIKSNIN